MSDEYGEHYDFYREWDYEIRVLGPGVVVRGRNYEAPNSDEYWEETRVDPREVEGETMADRRWAMIRLGLARLNSRRKDATPTTRRETVSEVSEDTIEEIRREEDEEDG